MIIDEDGCRHSRHRIVVKTNFKAPLRIHRINANRIEILNMFEFKLGNVLYQNNGIKIMCQTNTIPKRIHSSRSKLTLGLFHSNFIS